MMGEKPGDSCCLPRGLMLLPADWGCLEQDRNTDWGGGLFCLWKDEASSLRLGKWTGLVGEFLEYFFSVCNFISTGFGSF